MSDVYTLAARYGVQYSGTLVDDTYHQRVDYRASFTLADVAAQGGRITRVRILAERSSGRFDVSYVHATLPDGRIVPVYVSASSHGNLLRAHRDRSGQWHGGILGWLVQWAKLEGVHGKSIGLLDESVRAILWD